MAIEGVVAIRGVLFPTEHITAECLSLGGKVVQQPELNEALDAAYKRHTRATGREPDTLILSKEPATQFIPRRVRLHEGPYDIKGKESSLLIYFAVPRIFVA